MSRRRLIAAAGVATAVAAVPRVRAAPSPARDLVLAGGDVLTMMPGETIRRGQDVHVRSGAIHAIGPELAVPGAERIDVAGRIVLPGLVDTHWHVWTALLRDLADNSAGRGYFALTGMLGARFSPTDMRLAARLAAAEAIDGGITTVHDWCHNIRSAAHARAALDGLAASGLRARFTYGATRETPYDRPLDGRDFARLHAEWPRWAADGRLTLGVGWRGLLAAVNGKPVDVPAATWRHDLALARDRGLPVSVHANNSAANRGHIRLLAKAGLIARDLQVVHAVNAAPDEIATLADGGASVSLAPTSELTIGFGIPPVAALRAAGVAIGASVDTTTLTGRADLLRELQLLQGVCNAQTEDEHAMSAADALAIGTRIGAQTLGLGNWTGKLAPGMRADIIVVDRAALRVATATDPATMLLRSTGPRNITLVMVDGRILKRDGRLTGTDLGRLRAQATQTANRLMREDS